MFNSSHSLVLLGVLFCCYQSPILFPNRFFFFTSRKKVGLGTRHACPLLGRGEGLNIESQDPLLYHVRVWQRRTQYTELLCTWVICGEVWGFDTSNIEPYDCGAVLVVQLFPDARKGVKFDLCLVRRRSCWRSR